MKKVFLFSIGLTILIFSCRKLVVRDVNPDLTLDHCINSTMDGDEMGVDCGGAECGTCDQTMVPCTLDTNVLKISTNGFTLNTKTLINETLDTTGGTWEFMAYTNPSYYLFIRFNSKPSVTTIYNGTENTNLDAGEVSVTYFQPGLENLTGLGDVYVNYDNGAYTISSCNFGFHLPSSSAPSFTQSFSLTVN